MTIVLNHSDKLTLCLAQDLLRKVGCDGSCGTCWGDCKTPLVIELEKLIETLTTRGHVPSYVANAHEMKGMTNE